jgi:hypothetical protein
VMTASLVTGQGCRTRGVLKRRVSGLYGASWGAGAVLVALVMWPVIVGLWFVFQRGSEQGIRPSSTDMSTMTWQSHLMCEVSWWAHSA